jgi:ribonuclease P protein component
MLPRRLRMPRELFGELLKASRYVQSPHFTLRFQLGSKETHFGVSVSKKVSKSAVTRNTIRRRVYSALRERSLKYAGLFLIVAKSQAEKQKGEMLIKEIDELFSKVS